MLCPKCKKEYEAYKNDGRFYYTDRNGKNHKVYMCKRCTEEVLHALNKEVSIEFKFKGESK